MESEPLVPSTVSAGASTPARWLEKIAALERRLGGDGYPHPRPEGWQAAAGAAARIGVVAAKLDNGGYRAGRSTGADDTVASDVLAHRSAESFPAASTLKVFVLQALLEAVAAGRLGLAETRSLTEAEPVTGSGVLKLLSPGTTLSLLDIATLMITVSDNTATNMLIDVLGIDAIRASVEANGWADTHLSGKLQQAPPLAAHKSSPSVTSPRDLADHFSRLWSGELLPTELTAIAKAIYRRQQFSELGRSLDYDGYSAEIGASQMLIASKSGSIRGVRNDAGVIELGRESVAGAEPVAGRAYVIAVMTDGCPDRRFHADNLGALVVGEVAACTLEELAG